MPVRTPVVVVNFKTYPESAGARGIGLARICDRAASDTGGSLVLVPPATDIREVAQTVKVPVWAQAADAVEPGGWTGHILLEGLKEAGASGTLINHSERRLKAADIEFLVAKARRLSLETCICTNNEAVSRASAALEPAFIAVEPPELIGGDISVTSAKPEVVSRSVEAVKSLSPRVKVLCGAGVKNGADVRKALGLGADGVLLASGVVKAKEPEKVLVEMLRAL